MNASPGTLVLCDNILGESEPDEDPTDESVDSLDRRGGGVTAGRGDVDAEHER